LQRTKEELGRRAAGEGGFHFLQFFLVASVFNIFVENSVEKGHSISVSDSPREGSALCTEAGAGTFVALRTGETIA
jgi:hypothetical protein